MRFCINGYTIFTGLWRRQEKEAGEGTEENMHEGKVAMSSILNASFRASKWQYTLLFKLAQNILASDYYECSAIISEVLGSGSYFLLQTLMSFFLIEKIF